MNVRAQDCSTEGQTPSSSRLTSEGMAVITTLDDLGFQAKAALRRLRLYRGGMPMAEVWRPIEGYSPDEQRRDDRKDLCDGLLDLIDRGAKLKASNPNTEGRKEN